MLLIRSDRMKLAALFEGMFGRLASKPVCGFRWSLSQARRGLWPWPNSIRRHQWQQETAPKETYSNEVEKNHDCTSLDKSWIHCSFVRLFVCLIVGPMGLHFHKNGYRKTASKNIAGDCQKGSNKNSMAAGFATLSAGFPTLWRQCWPLKPTMPAMTYLNVNLQWPQIPLEYPIWYTI